MWNVQRANKGPVSNLFYLVDADNGARFKLKNKDESFTPLPKQFVGRHPSKQVLTSRLDSGYFESAVDAARFCMSNRIRWRLNVSG